MRPELRYRSLAPAVAAGLLAGCGMTPITNKLNPGEQPFIIAVGEGADGNTDLFAAATGGGAFIQLTFSRPAERLPAISPRGTAVAFLRSARADDSTGTELVVYDLVRGGERRARLPERVGRVTGLGWNRAGDSVFLVGRTVLVTPAALIELADAGAGLRARADSATATLFGEPPFGRIARCGPEPCVVTPAGDTTRLGEDVLEVVRWGPDSLAIRFPRALEVRPLGGGRPRRPLWTGMPAGFRHPTYHPGTDESTGR